MTEQERKEAVLLLQSFYDLLEIMYLKNPKDKETINRILDNINLLREVLKPNEEDK